MSSYRRPDAGVEERYRLGRCCVMGVSLCSDGREFRFLRAWSICSCGTEQVDRPSIQENMLQGMVDLSREGVPVLGNVVVGERLIL